MRTHTNTAQDTEDFGWQLACARPAQQAPFAQPPLALQPQEGGASIVIGRGPCAGTHEALKSRTRVFIFGVHPRKFVRTPGSIGRKSGTIPVSWLRPNGRPARHDRPAGLPRPDVIGDRIWQV